MEQLPLNVSDLQYLENLERRDKKLSRIDRISTRTFLAVASLIGLEMGYFTLEKFTDRLHQHSLTEIITLATSLGIGNLLGLLLVRIHSKKEDVNIKMKIFLQEKLRHADKN